MNKPRPDLSIVLDDLSSKAPLPAAVMVGANLDPTYAKGVALIHARTRMTKKDIMQRALDLLFAEHGITPQTLRDL